MSLVGPEDDLVHQRVMQMSRKGVVFVAAAGNGGPGAPPAYPAAYSEVIAVTAVDARRRNYPHANRGGYIDVAAPGVGIWTALPENKEGKLSGTSFATPFVTAIGAAIYGSSQLNAASREKRSPLDPKTVMLARFTIDKIGDGIPGERDPTYGLGLVQAPTSCSPGDQRWVPTVQRAPSRQEPWQATIQRASLSAQ